MLYRVKLPVALTVDIECNKPDREALLDEAKQLLRVGMQDYCVSAEVNSITSIKEVLVLKNSFGEEILEMVQSPTNPHFNLLELAKNCYKVGTTKAHLITLMKRNFSVFYKDKEYSYDSLKAESQELLKSLINRCVDETFPPVDDRHLVDIKPGDSFFTIVHGEIMPDDIDTVRQKFSPSGITTVLVTKRGTVVTAENFANTLFCSSLEAMGHKSSTN